MRRRRSTRTAALMLATVAVLTAAPVRAGAVPVEWHDGVHPRPLGVATVLDVRSGDRSAWSTIAAASETAVGVMRATVCGGAGEATDGSLRSVVMGAISCVLRAGWMVTKGVPLPRAAAGAAVESLTRSAGNEDSRIVEETNGQAVATGEVDNERTRDADSR